MALQPGSRLGPYEVQSALGAGGMGEVYKARDTRLDRTVAIKILPEDLAADSQFRDRFDREARSISQLDHPHICALYDVGQQDGTAYLVMQYLEGETLADRLTKGALPLDQALHVAIQIAGALEVAHNAGIVHRDLKPGNIMLTRNGAKLLDFGLAKSGPPVLGVTNLSNLPTTPPITQQGSILGTFQYMAPEQLEGREADARTDIWAFGLVLFEMLTGQPGFTGKTALDVLAKVLNTDPVWAALPALTPPAIKSLLRRCLQKDRNSRLRDVADARFRIEEVQNEPGVVAPAQSHQRRERLVWVAVVLAVAAIVTAVTRSMIRPPADTEEVRLEISTPPTTEPTSLAISPDGRTLAFVAISDGTSRLWIRHLNDTTARLLAGTDNAKFPFWSPDSRSIGFTVEVDLKRVDVESGAVQTVAPNISSEGGAWGADDTILSTPAAGGAMGRIAATGGKWVPVTQTSSREVGDSFPQFLPDGRHFICYALGQESGIYVGELGSTRTRRILETNSPAVYTASGHLLFVRQGTLFAQRFDTTRFELVGEAIPVAQQVVTSGGSTALSASAAGPIVYRTGALGTQRQLVWFDRTGRTLETVKGTQNIAANAWSLSRDGARVAMAQGDPRTDLWLLDLARGVPSRFTFESDTQYSMYPVWSPDGRQIAYSSSPEGHMQVFVKPTTGSESGERLVPGTDTQLVDDWSPDGRYVLFTSTGLVANEVKKDARDLYKSEIWAAPIARAGKVVPVVRTPYVAAEGQFSPDGKWIAFQSNEGGPYEIFVQPFPGPGDKHQVSAGGGVQVRWRADGKELFYLAPDNRMMAVPFRFDSPDNPAGAPAIGSPVPLFKARLSGAPQGLTVRSYSVARDGQRFLLDVPVETSLPVTVILNWKPKP